MEYIGFDVETTGLRPYHGNRIFAYCLACWDGSVKVIRISPVERERKKQRAALQEIISDPTTALIAHNLKFELSMLAVEGYEVPDNKELHDTMIIHQLLKNLRRADGLDEIAYDLCGYSMTLDKQVREIAKSYGGYHKVPVHLMNKYQIADGERTMIIFRTLWPDLVADKKLLSDYWNEIALIRTTQRMEQHGMYLNKEESNKLCDWLLMKSGEVEDKVVSLLGEWVKLSSGDQVANLLFNKLKMPILQLTDGKRPATGEPVLTKLKEISPHPILDLIIEYRGYIKSLGTIKGYFRHLDSSGMLHPNIKTNHAATGREACEEPNLQNVSKESELAGRPYSERRCYSPPAGHYLVFVDYSGIELRLIVEVTGEVFFTKLLLEGGDPHTVATEIFFMGKNGVTIKKNLLDKTVWKDYRNHAKNAHFAKCYGARLPKMANTLMMSIEETQPGYTEYCTRFPKMAFFTEDIIQVIKRQGYVQTPFGRKLFVDRSMPHEGANYLIQGTAAGILKRAQVRVDDYCRKELDYRVRPILAIHDEIVFSYPIDLWERRNEVLGNISKIMTTMPEIHIPLEVEWKFSSTTWDRAQGIDLYRPKTLSKVRRLHG